MENDELLTYYRQYYRSMFLFAFSFTKNKEDAEDLVSNAFLKAIMCFESGNFKAWIYTVIRNEFINTYKKDQYLSHEEDATKHICSCEDVLNDYICKEEQKWLYQQIFLLPDKERQIMLLSSFHEINDEEISNILHMTVSNVRVTKHRTRKKLMKLYEEVWQ